MLKKYSLKALQKAINRALALDETMPEKIQALQGKSLEIVIQPLGVNFFIHFNQQQIELLDSLPQPADTQIISNPLGLIRLSLLPASKARSLFNDKIRINGDTELGLKVKQLFEELDIDWEGHLAEFTGDVVAHQVSSVFHKGLSLAKQFGTSFCLNASDYLHEEAKIFPSQLELEDFFNDIDTLSLDVERMQAHLDQFLAKKHDKTA